MIEFERQISEAPDICVIIVLAPDGSAKVDRFEDEQGMVYVFGEEEFSKVMHKHEDEINAAIDYAKQFHEEYYVGE